MSDMKEMGSPKQGVESSATPTSASEAADLARQIEERAAAQQTQPHQRRATDRLRARMRVAFLSFAALIAVLSVVIPQYLVVRAGTELEFPPEELLGTWSTDEPRYADRTIAISREQLRLSLGAEGQTVHAISAIRAQVGEVHREYEITYAGPEGDQVLEVFVYDDGQLRLRNPSEVVWSRARE